MDKMYPLKKLFFHWFDVVAGALMSTFLVNGTVMLNCYQQTSEIWMAWNTRHLILLVVMIC